VQAGKGRKTNAADECQQCDNHAHEKSASRAKRQRAPSPVDRQRRAPPVPGDGSPRMQTLPPYAVPTAHRTGPS
jgi:hypothetical protein